MGTRPRWLVGTLLLAGVHASAADLAVWDGKVPQGGAAAFGVWNADILDKVNPDHFQFTGPGDKPGTITMVGPRNGACSGQIVVSDATSLAGLKAAMSPLRGAGVIPADRIRIRFAGMKPAEELERLRFEGYQSPYFSDLLDSPPAAGTVPVWVTVKIPQDAAPGKYTGALSVISAAGKKLEVSVELTVSAWVCPPPLEWTPHMGIIQSPDAVALKYAKKLWSDEHFQLIEKSYQYIGELGGNLAWVPMVNQALSRGANVSMVRYEMDADGSAKCDFTTSTVRD